MVMDPSLTDFHLEKYVTLSLLSIDRYSDTLYLHQN
jgi:hypothetical protein